MRIHLLQYGRCGHPRIVIGRRLPVLPFSSLAAVHVRGMHWHLLVPAPLLINVLIFFSCSDIIPKFDWTIPDIGVRLRVKEDIVSYSAIGLASVVFRVAFLPRNAAAK